MFSITVATSLCASGMFVHNGETTTYVCEKVEPGTLVRISVNGTATRLSLCEVEVHGYPFSFYENAGKGRIFIREGSTIGINE